MLSFHARVVLVKDLPAGTAISYNRTKVLTRDSRVAIVAVGYGDGVPTAASNRGSFLLRGRRCPILGRVTMDQTIVDVTDVPEARRGDEVEYERSVFFDLLGLITIPLSVRGEEARLAAAQSREIGRAHV